MINLLETTGVDMVLAVIGLLTLVIGVFVFYVNRHDSHKSKHKSKHKHA